MIIVYEKGTNKFKGLATRVFDNGTMREATLEELYPDEDHFKLGFVIVKDHIKYALDPNAWEFKLDEKGAPIDIVRKAASPKIQLSTDAEDEDEDGLPELPADGKSQANIFIEIRDHDGSVPKTEYDLRFSTTGGRLSQRRLSTKKGKAKVQLTAVTETITITVTVEANGLDSKSLAFELMPAGDEN